MFDEVSGLLEQMENVAEKYKHSGMVLYTVAFTLVEEGQEEDHVSALCGWNCNDAEEMSKVMQAQIAAFVQSEEGGPDVEFNYSLN